MRSVLSSVVVAGLCLAQSFQGSLRGRLTDPNGAAVPSAKITVVDEGTFILRENGREVGREVFAIRRSGTGPGAVVVAQGRVDLGESDDLVTQLEVSGEGFRPATYAVQVEGTEPQRIAGRGP